MHIVVLTGRIAAIGRSSLFLLDTCRLYRMEANDDLLRKTAVDFPISEFVHCDQNQPCSCWHNTGAVKVQGTA
jgi:hypothetical protein